MGNAPNKAYRVGGVEIAEYFSDNGSSFTIRKSYKNNTTQQWEETKYFYLEDLLKLKAAIDRAIVRNVKVTEPINNQNQGGNQPQGNYNSTNDPWSNNPPANNHKQGVNYNQSQLNNYQNPPANNGGNNDDEIPF